MAAPLLALHGFSLTGEMFAELTALGDRPVLAPDLPGHGDAAGARPVVDVAVGRVVHAITEGGAPLPVLGYSLGGRVALWVALERPDLVSRLIMVSASPGIGGKGDRAARRASDEALAARIERLGIDTFLDEWLARPMFAGLARRGEEWQAADRARRAGNDPARLAAALRGLGQAAMPYAGDRLAELAMPVLLVAGERDERHVDIARWMADRIANASVEVVPSVGHSVVGEAPEALAALVSGFLGSA